MDRCQFQKRISPCFFSTFYSRKLKIYTPHTPGTPKIADTRRVAPFTPTAAPKLCPRNSRTPPATAEPNIRRHTCNGFDRAISASANRHTNMAQVIT